MSWVNTQCNLFLSLSNTCNTHSHRVLCVVHICVYVYVCIRAIVFDPTYMCVHVSSMSIVASRHCFPLAVRRLDRPTEFCFQSFFLILIRKHFSLFRKFIGSTSRMDQMSFYYRKTVDRAVKKLINKQYPEVGMVWHISKFGWKKYQFGLGRNAFTRDEILSRWWLAYDLSIYLTIEKMELNILMSSKKCYKESIWTQPDMEFK